ncbi:MAG: hypothetical protein RLY78_4136 [Pseudomonadota bacterium]
MSSAERDPPDGRPDGASPGAPAAAAAAMPTAVPTAAPSSTPATPADPPGAVPHPRPHPRPHHHLHHRLLWLPLARLLRPVGLRVRPRLLLALLVGAAVWWVVPEAAALWAGVGAASAVAIEEPVTRCLLAWNAGAGAHLLMVLPMMWRSTPEAMRRRALTQDEGRLVILAAVVLAAAVVLLAVASQLTVARALHGPARQAHVALAVVTVLGSWAFTQVMFALHYAHDFYLARAAGRPDPLVFPGTRDPDYVDFLYFAGVLGTAAQTADVTFHGRALRPTGLLHGVLAFFWNTGVLALTVNVAASLF